MHDLLELAIASAKQAGKVILEHYQNSDLMFQLKGDGTPLTIADRSAHDTIINFLGNAGFPIVSEEGGDLLIAAETYWLVDPLDGTKDFLSRNGEFTVNIALVRNSMPVLGVVFAPAIDAMYWGTDSGEGAWYSKGGVSKRLQPDLRSPDSRMAVSRFHDHPDVEVFAKQNRIQIRVEIGSALKYGLLAAGEVDVYPRLIGSSEWDTAAGQAVLEASGGCVLDWHRGEPLRYGKAGRRNPRLLALSARHRREDFVLMPYSEELL